MDDQVEPVKLQFADDGRAEPPEAGPAVVVVPRAFRQPETGQVPGDSPQPARRELGQNLAIAERRAQHPVDADDWLAVALGPDETLDAGRGEGPAGVAVGAEGAR